MLAALPVAVPEILLPAPGVDLSRWAVIACDQYTSQRGYWEALERHVGDAPSTLRMIVPEAHLADGDLEQRIARARACMRDYLERGVLEPPRRGFVVVERESRGEAPRRGLLLALDLAHYDHRDGSRTLVRVTERTIEERLPVRVRLREGAPLELPHVLVLVDDPRHLLIEPLLERARSRAPLYDTALWPRGGRVRGWRADAPTEIGHVERALRALLAPQRDEGLLFAVGDGNHSLAAARLCWERLRDALGEAAALAHPARWALVEVVNLHDPALRFEPIHRLLFGADPGEVLASLPGWLAERGARGRTATAVEWVAGGRTGVVEIDAAADLPIATLQAFLDAWVEKHEGASLDYIHGEGALRGLAAAPRRIGFLLPALDKRKLFPAVRAGGPLPRKTFSLGEADDKRFYLEARRILP